MHTTRGGIAALTAAGAILALSACVPNSPAGGEAAVTVESTVDDCAVSTATAPSGIVTFDVTNATDLTTEFYVLADDELRIVGEVENIAPGAPRALTVQLTPGEYFTVCKPGMVGDGVGKSSFTVTDSGADVSPVGGEADRIETAATNYVAYVKDQVAQLVTGTDAFLAAYTAGDDETARSLYAITRANYERIEPVAESFGDLDPAMDFREADVPAGDEWSGWHRIEKDLWPPTDAGYVALTAAERQSFSERLATDTAALYDAVHDPGYSVTIDAISNGAIGLMDEVATGKITGEEEIWSHTDLWDFSANLEGARVAYEGVRDIVEEKDAELVAELDDEFAALEADLAAYGSLDTGFVYYDELTPEQVKALADGVNALAEPLSRLTAALVG
ncbi:MAG: hypothetical protein RI885_699 [Actinomycetota bacterium]